MRISARLVQILGYHLITVTYVYAYSTYSRFVPSYHGVPSQQLCSSSGVSKTSYDYNFHSSNGPSNWYLISNCCKGHRQSPVHLKSTTALCDQPYSLRYRQSRSTSVTAQIYNNGHEASVIFAKSNRLTLLNVPHRAGNTYILGELHYHAGYSGGMGSEHWLDNKGYEGELHLVHYNSRYSSIKKATNKRDGLVVVAIMIENSDRSPNSELRRFVQHVSCLKAGEQKTTITMQPLHLIPRSKEFYLYEGSQTAPPCSESVLWMVMRDPLQLTTSRINTLQNLRHKDGSILSTFSNIRPLQELNSRLVETNFPCTNALHTFDVPYF